MTTLPTIRREWLAGITMTSEQKAKWLVALRSGEYKQGDGQLHWEGHYCCIGVAAKVCFGLTEAEMGSLGTLDGAGSKALGNWRAGDWAAGQPASVQSALGYLNDILKLSFDQIADFIEGHIPACDEGAP